MVFFRRTAGGQTLKLITQGRRCCYFSDYSMLVFKLLFIFEKAIHIPGLNMPVVTDRRGLGLPLLGVGRLPSPSGGACVTSSSAPPSCGTLNSTPLSAPGVAHTTGPNNSESPVASGETRNCWASSTTHWQLLSTVTVTVTVVYCGRNLNSVLPALLACQ